MRATELVNVEDDLLILAKWHCFVTVLAKTSCIMESTNAILHKGAYLKSNRKHAHEQAILPFLQGINDAVTNFMKAVAEIQKMRQY